MGDTYAWLQNHWWTTEEKKKKLRADSGGGRIACRHHGRLSVKDRKRPCPADAWSVVSGKRDRWDWLRRLVQQCLDELRCVSEWKGRADVQCLFARGKAHSTRSACKAVWTGIGKKNKLTAERKSLAEWNNIRREQTKSWGSRNSRLPQLLVLRRRLICQDNSWPAPA